MNPILVLFGFLMIFKQTPALAAPSIEACPPDSIVFEEICKCDPATCTKPTCLTELQISTNGTDLPGQCCPIYECTGCKDEEKIDGKCPCAEGAIIDGYECKCADKEKHLVDGNCVCDPLLCQIPQLCDKKSVPVTVTEGCCKKVICKQCPLDSESTNVEGDEIEDHCVCLPCKDMQCGYNLTAFIKKKGSGFPGNCCDLYECKKTEHINVTKYCQYNDLFYENGQEWVTSDSQICKCDNGLSLCSNQKEEEKEQDLACYIDKILYKHSETWTKDDGCTVCTCKNGAQECISHYCDGKENLIQVNHTCTDENDDMIYRHGIKWLDKDGCNMCICNNGVKSCTKEICESTTPQITTIKPIECQSLSNCNRSCPNGFKINRRGCEICKCNSVRLEEYKNNRETSSTSTTTTTTSTSKTVEVVTQIPVVIMNRNAFFEDELPRSTTTEPSVRPTDKETDSLIYIVIPVLACGIFVIVLAIMCVYKSRRKSSVDLSHCHYQSVNKHNNNNTIKKTDILL